MASSVVQIWNLARIHTFYPSSFKNDEVDEMFEEVFDNGYELVCFDQHGSRYIFRLAENRYES